MKIIKESDNRVIVQADPKIDITNSEKLKETAIELMREGFFCVVFDFSEVNKIDSFGLGKLLIINNLLQEKGRKLEIINVNSDYIQKMFSMIHLEDVISVEMK